MRKTGDTPRQPMIEDVWARFGAIMSGQAPEMAELIQAPATEEAIVTAEQRLRRSLPDELRRLYRCADGFAPGAYLLRDDYRILPLNEMVAASLALTGEPIILDVESGEMSRAAAVIRLVLAHARPDDEDVVQISLRLRTNKPGVEIWYREGGVHTFAEVVDGRESLTDWLTQLIDDYYGGPNDQ